MQPESNWINIYEDLNSMGIFVADLSLVITIIIGVMLLICGLYFICTDDESQFIRIKGNVVESMCEINTKNRYKYKCTLTVSYQIDGKKYEKKLEPYDTMEKYVKNESIDLIAIKCDHNIVKIAFKKMSKVGLTLILTAFICVGISYLNFYLSHNFKIYSAAQGVFVIFNLFNSLFVIINNNVNDGNNKNTKTSAITSAGVSELISEVVEII